VLDFLRSIAPNAATNEEIVSKTGVRPHTQVFQITRRLTNDGLLKAILSGKEWRFWYNGKRGSSPPIKQTGRDKYELRETDVPADLTNKDTKRDPTVTFRDSESMAIEERAEKPALSTDILLKGGFTLAARWQLAPDGRPQLDEMLPEDIGVYAFAFGGRVLYVGVATMGLRKRIYFYSKPGRSQRTSQRIHELIKRDLSSGREIEVYIALPPDSSWNGLPIHGSAGLELGLIRKYALAWNMRSAG
jgi:hypothetical protein